MPHTNSPASDSSEHPVPLLATGGWFYRSMRCLVWWLSSLIATSLANAQTGSNVSEKGFELFEKQVRPVLHRECLACHHQGKASGGLALDSRAGWLAGGDSGPAIVPGDPDSSLLIRAIRHTENGLEMPAKAPKLTPETIGHWETWVRLGAPDPRNTPEPFESQANQDWDQLVEERARWWCWQPLQLASPAEVGPQEIDHWIDHWIDQGIARANLKPAPIADRRTLIRRLHYQLCGLPPSQQEVNQFQNDTQPDAWAQCVERVLAKPEFGEHWTRHWMDVVRYADTHGSEDDAYLPYAYRYRDYMIRNFNADIPYNQWLGEHLAGDLLPARWNPQLGINEALIGLAFFRFVEFNQTPVDVKREEIVVIDSQIDTLGKAFQGITISCARCHDHKFDPISDEDYYALYGILRSTRTYMQILDDPSLFERDRERLQSAQTMLRQRLANDWTQQLAAWPQALEVARHWCREHCVPNAKWEDVEKQLPDQPWTRLVAKAIMRPKDSPFQALANLLNSDPSETHRIWARLRADHPGHQDVIVQRASDDQPLFDLTEGDLQGWQASGVGLPQAPFRAGRWLVQGGRDNPLAGLLESGYHSNAISDRHAGSLRSPDFVIASDEISLLVRGSGGARARLVIENFQGDSLLFSTVNPTLNSSSLQWVTMTLRPQWQGLRAHIELLTRDDKPYVGIIKDPQVLEASDGRSSFGIARVVQHPRGKRPRNPSILPSELVSWPLALEAPTESDDVEGTNRTIGTIDHRLCIQAICRASENAIARFRDDRTTDEDARWLHALLEAAVLSGDCPDDREFSKELALYKELEAAIPIARRSPGVREDLCAVNQPWLARGDHRQPGSDIPRRYLKILGGDSNKYAGPASGRLQLAQDLCDPRNPLTARVYVNRVWAWLCGKGLVTTVDNFGRMGEPPTHPELLDHLASEFMRQGWSTKQLIRTIVLSHMWQRVSTASPDSLERDPSNRWWSHADMRRLEAESIRDTLLWVTGDLRQQDSGLGTRVYYRTVLEANKQSPPGPVDGDKRRSIFLEVRRNFPNEFLLTFDFPRPTATIGHRGQTLIPAQSLTLLNDPFVQQQAKLWSARVLQAASSTPDRLGLFYTDLLNRLPSQAETSQAEQFLEHLRPQLSEKDAWYVFALAMFNLTEAIYLP